MAYFSCARGISATFTQYFLMFPTASTPVLWQGYWTHSHECLNFTYRSLRGLVMKFLSRVYPLLAVLSKERSFQP